MQRDFLGRPLTISPSWGQNANKKNSFCSTKEFQLQCIQITLCKLCTTYLCIYLCLGDGKSPGDGTGFRTRECPSNMWTLEFISSLSWTRDGLHLYIQFKSYPDNHDYLDTISINQILNRKRFKHFSKCYISSIWLYCCIFPSAVTKFATKSKQKPDSMSNGSKCGTGKHM